MNAANRERRLTHAASLWALLRDGRWHHHREMVRAAGTRFGARLHELHRRDDKPVHYQRRVRPDAEWDVVYRLTDADHCCLCAGPVRQNLRTHVRLLEAQVAGLQALVRELNGVGA